MTRKWLGKVSETIFDLIPCFVICPMLLELLDQFSSLVTVDVHPSDVSSEIAGLPLVV